MSELNERTGFNTVGFRGIGSNLIVEITEVHLETLTSTGPKVEEPKSALDALDLPEPVKLFKGAKAEEAEKHKDLVFKVVALSNSIAVNPDAPQVGQYVGLKHGTGMGSFNFEGAEYGIIPFHTVQFVLNEDFKCEA